MSGVLVIDDDPSISLLVRQAVVHLQVPVTSAGTAREGYETARRERPDVLILDVMLPDEPGLELFDRLRALDAKTPVIVVTAGSASAIAIKAMRQGAYDFLAKPLQLADIRQRIERALEICELTRAPCEVRAPSDGADAEGELLVGRSARMQQVYKAIGRVANTDISVLIRGESGTGKELAARVIHQHSRRAARPFFALHCAKTADVEGELIGALRPGVARRDRDPTLRFQRALGGTLFLDEVGELSLSLQSTLVNILLDQTCAVAGEPPTEANGARVLAATSRNLQQLLAAGQFRADLFYHLSGSTIEMPPLRERLEDVPALANHFLARQRRLLRKRVYRLAPESLEALRKYHWPGNVRELESLLVEALLRTTGGVLVPESLPPMICEEPPTAASGASRTAWEAFLHERLAAGSEQIYAEAQVLMERELLTLLLGRTGGHQAQAAKLLGITRSRLRQKLRALGLVINRHIDRQQVEDGSDSMPLSP